MLGGFFCVLRLGRSKHPCIQTIRVHSRYIPVIRLFCISNLPLKLFSYLSSHNYDKVSQMAILTKWFKGSIGIHYKFNKSNSERGIHVTYCCYHFIEQISFRYDRTAASYLAVLSYGILTSGSELALAFGLATSMLRLQVAFSLLSSLLPTAYHL